MAISDEVRRMHWDAINERRLRGLYAAMDDLAAELERARQRTSADASEMARSLIASSAARITGSAATFAEHAYALDALREAGHVFIPSEEK